MRYILLGCIVLTFSLVSISHTWLDFGSFSVVDNRDSFAEALTLARLNNVGSTGVRAEPKYETESMSTSESARYQDEKRLDSSGDIPAPSNIDSRELERLQSRYDRDLSEWREITRRLLEIRVLYTTCTQSEADAYVLEWEKKQTRGRELIESLTQCSFELLKANPRDDANRQFLTAMAARLYFEDRSEEVYEIGQFLMSYPDHHQMLYEQVGVSAFSMNRFTEAQPLIRKAKSLGSEDQRLAVYDAASEAIQALWAQELEYQKRDSAGEPLPVVKLTTTQGEILIELFENDAPMTVGNFVHLVESGFYDGLVFHRVLQQFMAQSGCPLGTGTGGPGYTIPSECNGDEFRRHFGGVVSMANTGDPDTGGSQFFLTFSPTPQLDGLHTVFGRIIEGHDVLPRIQRIDPNNPDVAGGAEPDSILKAEVLSKRDHEYVPTKNEKR